MTTTACYSREGETSKLDICLVIESVLLKSKEVRFSLKVGHRERKVIIPPDESAGSGYLSSTEKWSLFKTL